LSEKRTLFEVERGFFWAAAKSEERDGLLGDVRVGEVGSMVLAENWEVRSWSWERRRGSWDVIALVGGQ
jgi:hypothetical protein